MSAGELMVAVLRISRAGFALLIALVSAFETFLASILPLYLPAMLIVPTVTLASGVSVALIVYLMTEEQEVQPP